MLILPFDLAWPMVVFAAVMALTPGPNNVIALASGATFGLRATLPFVGGVAVGVGSMVLAVAAGIGAVLAALPWAYPAMKIAGAVYLLWLAVSIARSSSIDGEGTARPLTFLQAAAFQWVNPKAWILVVGGVATHAAADRYWPLVILLAIVAVVVTWPSAGTWAAFGLALRRVLDTPARIRAFNLVMAGLLVASLWPVLSDLWR